MSKQFIQNEMPVIGSVYKSKHDLLLFEKVYQGDSLNPVLNVSLERNEMFLIIEIVNNDQDRSMGSRSFKILAGMKLGWLLIVNNWQDLFVEVPKPVTTK